MQKGDEYANMKQFLIIPDKFWLPRRPRDLGQRTKVNLEPAGIKLDTKAGCAIMNTFQNILNTHEDKKINCC